MMPETVARPPEERGSTQAPPNKPLLVLIALVTGFHLLSILVWMSPSSVVRDQLLRYVSKYVIVAKSTQNWSMFAPDPMSVNRRIVVDAELSSGAHREIDITQPLFDTVHSWSTRQVGRHIKAHDFILVTDNEAHRRGFAQYECRKLREEWGEVPKRVKLIRAFEVIQVNPKSLVSWLTRTERYDLGTYDCSP